MGIKVVKFGGSSLASASQIVKAAAIIQADPDRRYVVASAPGKRTSDDTKVTDLLYQTYEQRHGDYARPLSEIRQRYAEIARDLGVTIDLEPEFAEIESHLASGDSADYFASRGEYLNSMIIAAYLGWAFVDAADVVRFCESGEFMADETDTLLAERLHGLDHAVVPGFYGATPSGVIHTFPRGGSDVTGALVARAVDANVYENWTDVSGIYAADPRIVDSPRSIRRISYAALRELTYLGASVLHENAISPVREKRIPINIRNTNIPEDPGTWIAPMDYSWTNPDEEPTRDETPGSDGASRQPFPTSTLVGLAGKVGYSCVTVRKAQWSGSLGVGPALLAVFDEAEIVVDMLVASIDTWTFVVRIHHDQIDDLARRIRSATSADSIEVRSDLALLGVVGTSTPAPELQALRGCFPTVDLGLRAADALAEAGIWVFAMSSPGGYNSVDAHLLLIDAGNYENAVRTLYSALA